MYTKTFLFISSLSAHECSDKPPDVTDETDGPFFVTKLWNQIFVVYGAKPLQIDPKNMSDCTGIQNRSDNTSVYPPLFLALQYL